ncbi:energy-coupling factor transporter transmembrane component T family protein [Cryptobacterium curtum]
MGASSFTQGVLGLDPRTHLTAVILIGVSTILLVELPLEIVLQVIAALYLSLNGHFGLSVRCCVFFVVILVLSFAPLPGLYGVLFVSLMHITPPFTAACALFSLSPSAIMGALSRWHVTPIVRIGVCMMFRFTALLGFEACQVVRGIRMRGIFTRWSDIFFHPALAYECIYAPLVMRCLRLSSELAASAELRGALVPGERSTVYQVGLSWRDGVVVLCLAIICIALVAVSVVL